MTAASSLPRVDADAVSSRLHALMGRAGRAARAGNFDDAHELFDAAYVLGSAAGESEIVAESLAGVGLVAHLRGMVLAAEPLYVQALEETKHAELRAIVRSRLGFAYYDRGDLEAADELWADVANDAPTPTLRARATGYRGNVARARGESRRAIAFYDGATKTLAACGDERYVATFAMDRAVAELLRGRLPPALVELEALAQQPTVSTDASLDMLVNHYTAVARLRLGLPFVERAFDDQLLGRYLAGARHLAGAASADALSALEEAAPLNAHARITLQLVSTPRAHADPRALVVSRSGAFFRLGGSELVSLVQRPRLARVLLVLARARIATPGKVIEGERLVELAWPGERILPVARKNRLHVAMTTLRKLGLRPVLESRADGYRVGRDVSVVIVD